VEPNAALYDSQAGVFKLWYSINQRLEDGGAGMGVATSVDGIHWTKPRLGLVEYEGSTGNNVCRLEPWGRAMRALDFSLIRDPRPDVPERRYKAIGTDVVHPDGTYYGGWVGFANSSDGTTWHAVRSGVRVGAGGGRPSCVWDEKLQRYVLFQRQLTESARGNKRYIVRQESSDLKTWSPRQTVFNPVGSKWSQVESMPVFRHEGIYIGLAYMLDIDVTGQMEPHLLTSRDGFHWDYPFPDEAFIPRGIRGEFDDTLLDGVQPVMRDDQIYFYYGGTQSSHAYPPEPIVDDGGSINFWGHGKGKTVFRPTKIGLATLPMDRFAGLRADEPVGAFLTRPLEIEGEDLYVNADVDRELRIEVVDPISELVDEGSKGGWAGHYIRGKERVFPGFSLKDCPAITGDSLRHRVRWKGGNLGAFKGKSVRLRFVYRLGIVYALQIE
jgi:hypothetical protein